MTALATPDGVAIFTTPPDVVPRDPAEVAELALAMRDAHASVAVVETGVDGCRDYM